jgi:hypothetical protein
MFGDRWVHAHLSPILLEVFRMNHADTPHKYQMEDCIEAVLKIRNCLTVMIDLQTKLSASIEDCIYKVQDGDFNVMLEHYCHVTIDKVYDWGSLQTLLNSINEALEEEGWNDAK